MHNPKLPNIQTVLLLTPPKVFTGSDVEFTFICVGEKATSAKSTKHFLNMGCMLGKVIQVDQDVVQIDNDLKVYHICEDTVHKPLKSCRGISSPLGITSLSKDPYWVQKVVFHLSPAVIHTRWYAC